MSRIQIPWIGLLLLVVLIRGEFYVNLGDRHVPNMFLVRVDGGVNQTEQRCSTIRVADLFPDRMIDLRSGNQGPIEPGPVFMEPLVVTIYNPDLDQVCETQRKYIAMSDPSIEPVVRIFHACYDSKTPCKGETIRVRDATLTVGPLQRIRLRSRELFFSSSEVSMHSIKSNGNHSFGVTISVSPQEVLVLEELSNSVIETLLPATTRQLQSNHHLNSANQRRRQTSSHIPSFQSNQTEVYTSPITNTSISPFSVGLEPNLQSDVLPTSTRARSAPSDMCTLLFDECCSNSDCTSIDQICVSRACIDLGYPRFTLSWIGDDDYDLYVVTPSGYTLSYEGDIDEKTGGTVGESMGQFSYGNHVENIFFPLDGSAPPGTYQFYVRPLTIVGVDEPWTVEVVDESGTVISHNGTRFSPVYEYVRSGVHSNQSLPSPTPSTLSPISKSYPSPTPTLSATSSGIPTPSPTVMSEATNGPTITPEDPLEEDVQAPEYPFFESSCDLLADECCADNDCLFSGEVCFNRNCIDDGNPRITLSWVGDDDLDLFVLTPGGVELSFVNFFDPISQGRFGEDMDQFGTGHHVENVYFPIYGAPYGVYEFFVRPLTTVEEKDIWTLTVVDDGSTVISETGAGPSPRFFYLRERPNLSPSPPTLSPISMPNTLPPVSRPTSPPNSNGPDISPTAVPSTDQIIPGVSPTRPPQTDTECNPFFDECCENSDCRSSLDVCEQRTCIRDGNPRFTLTWDGDDEFDLFVYTPDGIEISRSRPFDIFSGGRFETNPNRNQTDRHVESVYFPILGTPTGVYTYEVRSPSGIEPSDTWSLNVYDNGELVSSDTGTGSSGELQYMKNETIEGPQRPFPSPPRCSPISDECCLDIDCEGENSLCVQRTCIDDGSPRFTLRWTGDDDLNLIVETPHGVVLSEANQIDPITGGRFQQSTQKDEFGFHVENVYFPADRSAVGTYRYNVESAQIRGGGADVWHVSVFDKGAEIKNVTGIGDSREFLYERMEGGFPPTPTPPPSDGDLCSQLTDECCKDLDCESGQICFEQQCIPQAPTPNALPSLSPALQPITERPPPGQSPTTSRECPQECCSNIDCGGSMEVCVQRTCITDGRLRFTLTWTGNDDLSLVVVTPGGNTMSYLHPTDEESGGSFEQDSNQSEFGFHVESIVFPSSIGPEGEYKYFVKSTRTQGDGDRWALRVFVDGAIVTWRTGTGESRTYTYDYGADDFVPTAGPIVVPLTPAPVGSLAPVDTPAPVVPPAPIGTKPPATEPTTKSCQVNSECSGRGEICVQETCIDEGNPRFTLTWSGNDDLDLFVESPNGAVISKAEPYDPKSGGTFGESGDQSGFGRYVENIFFPLGPSGTYTYYVRSTQPQGSDDSWQASVSVGGDQVVVRSGSGDSVKFTFEFNSSDLAPPGTMPTQAPNSNTVCDVNSNECCSDLDCLGGEICTQRTCIDEGTPRFTLTWTGDDDLDLLVQTPDGTFVSFLNGFDEASGGRFGEPGDQFESGRHVENVYFPLEGSPLGTYKYFVKSFLVEGSDDVWTLDVFVNGQTVATTTGTGDSGMLTYDYSGSLQMVPVAPSTRDPTRSPSPQRRQPTRPLSPSDAPESPPTPSPNCSTSKNECCSDNDCITEVETCVQGHCIDQGNPRFTLSWTGDDDLDLKVKTPHGATISFIKPIDENSGGIYGEVGSQYEFGRHVENIYFLGGSSGRAPNGVYTYSVNSFIERNGNDRWTVAVFVDNKEVASETGFGDSVEFTYKFNTTGTVRAELPPPSCKLGTEECCEDADCAAGNEVCVQRICIDRGNPRFTLTWTGDDDLDLTVVSPFGTTLAISSPSDPLSGGVFGEDGDQLAFGRHVENIYFPLGGGPSGTYTFIVSSFEQVETADEWSVTVFVKDKPVLTEVGMGTSDVFVYEYSDGFTLPPEAKLATRLSPTALKTTEVSPLTTSCTLEKDECCSNSDCKGPGRLCVQRICIDEGNPRFTLTWNGNDDYDLLVIPPYGNEVSYARPVDYESGGRFGEDGFQSNPGLHIENVFFPIEGGPLGKYTINVHPFQVLDDQDSWTIGVFVDGKQKESFSGSGDSGSLIFEYKKGGIITGQEMVFSEVPSCSLKTYDCCIDDDCPGRRDKCLQRSCIPIGADEITIILTWIGNDDLDLTVFAPSGQEISYYMQEDADSGIFFEQSDTGKGSHQSHSERVTIPQGSAFPVIEGGDATGSNALIYRYRVSSFSVIGTDDEWVTRVFVNGTEVAKNKGKGNSPEDFTFAVDVPSSPASLARLSGLSPRVAEYASNESSAAVSSDIQNCTAPSDCPSSGFICLVERCLTGGSLQFTLAWECCDDLVLIIWSPDMITYQSTNTSISVSKPLGWESIDEQGLHVRNFVFSKSIQATPGKYKFSITTTEGTAARGHGGKAGWKLWIHENGRKVYEEDGASTASSFFGYTYNP